MNNITTYMYNTYEKFNTKIDTICDNTKKSYVLISAFCLLFYKLTLDFLYWAIVSKEYARWFFSDYKMIEYLGGIFAILVIIIPTIYLYYQQTISSIITVAINLIWYFPITTLYGLGYMPSNVFVMVIIYWTLFLFLQIKLPILVIKNTTNWKWISIFKHTSYIFCGVVSLCVIFIWAIYADFNLQWDILGVYETRYNSTLYQIPSAISFFYNFATVTIPMFMLYFMKRKNYFLACLQFIVIFLNFSIGGNKSFLFLGLLAIGGYIFYRSCRINLISIGLLGIAFLSSAIFYIMGSLTFISLLFRRAMFVLGDLTIDYYNYINEHSVNLFIRSLDSMAFLGMDETYSLPFTQIIGIDNSSGANANNGMLSDALSQVGMIGVFVYPIILVIILRILDYFGNNLDKRISIVICVSVIIMFVSTGWTSYILSGEMFVVCGLMYLFSQLDESEKQEKLKKSQGGLNDY